MKVSFAIKRTQMYLLLIKKQSISWNLKHDLQTQCKLSSFFADLQK